MRVFYFRQLTGRERRRLEACNECGAVLLAPLTTEHMRFHQDVDARVHRQVMNDHNPEPHGTGSPDWK